MPGRQSTALLKSTALGTLLQLIMIVLGHFAPTIAGLYTADTMEAEVSTATTYSGDGDYQMTEKVTGKRLGDCAA